MGQSYRSRLKSFSVDNGKANWYEVDFPEVIEFRKKYIAEEENRNFLAYSVFENDWYNQVEKAAI